LRAEIKALHEQRGEESEDDLPAFSKPNTHKHKRDKANKKTRRQRAAEQNAGRKRETPTEVQQHALERCPDCQYPLRGHSIARRRQVIELPTLPPVRVIEHEVIKRWCPVCRKWHVPKLDLSSEVLGQRRIGHGVAGLVCWLRTTLRLPVAMVRLLLKQIYQLTLSAGEIVELSHAVAEASQTQAQVNEIRRAIVKHDEVHMDETTWREDGDNGYVWAMSTTDGLRAYAFEFSRSGQVARGLLRGFTGTLVTDFYAGYNHTPGRHQRCWVHLLRDLHALNDTCAASASAGTRHPEVSAWVEAVIQTYRDAKAVDERARPPPAPPPTQSERQSLYDTLVERIQRLGRTWAQAIDKTHPAHALCKRLLRHDLELFEFVRQPGLAAHNNLAERSVRPLVIARKISGGTRSQRGSDTRMTLQTLFATWVAQGKPALDECAAMLAQPRADVSLLRI
jgi:hypothetical protein